MDIKLPPYLQDNEPFTVVTFALQRPYYEPNNGATSWFTVFGIGTPPQQQIRFMVDTGTKNSWVTSNLCTTSACAPHRKFVPASSSTYKAIGPPATIDFGAWGSMTITPSTDVIYLPGLSRPMLIEFDMSTNYEGDQFTELIADGGIGIPSHMPKGPNSTEILNVLEQTGVIKYAIASFWYDRSTLQGQTIFGGIDLTKFKVDTVNVLPLIDFPSDLECWLVNLDSFNGLFPDGTTKNILNNVAFALDTGSSQFKGDPKFIDAAKKVITNNGAYPETIVSPARVSDYPYPVLQLVLGGITYLLPPEKYFIQSSPTEWDLAFHFLADCEDEFLVGTTFLESLYTIFDYDSRCIIVAEPKF